MAYNLPLRRGTRKVHEEEEEEEVVDKKEAGEE